MHKVLRGPASQSYGLQVAKLAGVPDLIVNQAKQKLQSLETTELNSASLSTTKNKNTVDKKEFGVNPPANLSQGDMFATVSHPIEQLLRAKAADEMTPKQALELLYKVQEMFSKH